MRVVLIVVMLLSAVPLWAVQPDEVLDDPVLEAQAREISKDLRCLVCRNENIDESNADLARDMRLLVRERLVAGDDSDEVLSFIVDRYGEYVLLKPKLTGSNLILWIAGPVVLLIGLGLGVAYQRRNRIETERPVDALSAEEAARLQALLGDEPKTKS